MLAHDEIMRKIHIRSKVPLRGEAYKSLSHPTRKKTNKKNNGDDNISDQPVDHFQSLFRYILGLNAPEQNANTNGISSEWLRATPTMIARYTSQRVPTCHMITLAST